MSHHLLEGVQLCHRYADGTEALRGLDFCIRHGESVALVGANGAGKSTLLQHLNGTLLPTSGAVKIGGITVCKETLRDIRRTVGMVFQDPDDQLFMSTVFEDVAFGPRNLGLPDADVETRVRQALDRVEIGHLAHKPPFRLSGGEKRRAAIATVLSMSPDVLVMDEPSAGLDPRSRRQLIGLLKDFQHTKLIATHDLDLVLDLCDRTLVMHQGKLMADGPTREIFADAALLEACHLEKPFSMQGCPVCGRT
ncbi:energy-coupling factor ABC transporter ATP-binding protein [Holophaga foetida]|uniref:energy-coupling factor ABC transporter ATP-binding protein n=1 Tax=Holophaga foetida TaxID=35839 RepID=UPI000247468B|nr:ATP-binding cassette domain-containing protein [Holophaga foetida]